MALNHFAVPTRQPVLMKSRAEGSITNGELTVSGSCNQPTWQWSHDIHSPQALYLKLFN